MPVLYDQGTQRLDTLTVSLVSMTRTNDIPIIRAKRIMDRI